MALKANIFKATLEVSDVDRNHYATHALTIAQHPSENDERLMVRLLVFALHASEALVFGERMSDTDEPDLVEKDLTGAIELWIDVGQPDEARLRKACGKAKRVVVYAYSGHGAAKWWEQSAEGFQRFRNLSVKSLPPGAAAALAALCAPRMSLSAMIQEGSVMLVDGAKTVQVEPVTLK